MQTKFKSTKERKADFLCIIYRASIKRQWQMHSLAPISLQVKFINNVESVYIQRLPTSHYYFGHVIV